MKQRRMKIFLIMALSSLAFALNAGAEPDLEAGKKLYRKYCQKCHGETGEGREKMLKPLKLTDRGVVALSVVRKSSKEMSDLAMKTLILEGDRKRKMPGYRKELKPAAEKMTLDVVAFIRELQAK